jgi:hypothetical protein
MPARLRQLLQMSWHFNRENFEFVLLPLGKHKDPLVDAVPAPRCRTLPKMKIHPGMPSCRVMLKKRPPTAAPIPNHKVSLRSILHLLVKRMGLMLQWGFCQPVGSDARRIRMPTATPQHCTRHHNLIWPKGPHKFVCSTFGSKCCSRRDLLV